MNISRIAVAFVVAVAVSLSIVLAVTSSHAEEEGGKDLSSEWIHEDLETAYAVAQKSGKPLLIAFR